MQPVACSSGYRNFIRVACLSAQLQALTHASLGIFLFVLVRYRPNVANDLFIFETAPDFHVTCTILDSVQLAWSGAQMVRDSYLGLGILP